LKFNSSVDGEKKKANCKFDNNGFETLARTAAERKAAFSIAHGSSHSYSLLHRALVG